MLQNIRERAQGWIAWAIVILISIPFALWGIQSYLGIGGEPLAAKVEGVELDRHDLDRRVEQTRYELRQRLGTAYDPALIGERQLRRQVLGEMIDETLLQRISRRWGLHVPDQTVRMQILAEPAFQKDGRFDQETYERMLRMQGLSPTLFEAQLRQQLIGTQLVRAVGASAFATNPWIDDNLRLAAQQREVGFVRFAVSATEVAEAPDEARIEAFYEQNQSRFRSPERVKVDYLLLDASTLAAAEPLATEDLRQRYESEQARFTQPQRREVRHILIEVAQDAAAGADEAAREQLNALRARILAGESFAEVAEQASQDSGSAQEGGALGVVERGMMTPKFEEAAFALPVGELSEPVRTPFGYHLIEVTKVLPERVQPFTEVEEQVRADALRQRGEERFYDLGERLANLVYESPDSLEPAAEQLDLTIEHSDWIERSGGEGVLADPKVLAAAFSTEVMLDGNNSDMIEPQGETLQALVLRVAEHRPAAVRPLAEVHDEIVKTLEREAASDAALAAADAAAEQLREGGDWAALGDRDQVELGMIGRSGGDTPDARIPPEVLRTAFTMPHPQSGAPSVATTRLADGDAALVRVTAVVDGKTDDADGRRATAMLLERQLGAGAFAELLADLRAHAKIEIEDDALTSDEDAFD